MPQNPLQKYFRQPKIYISLPSQGAYSDPGVIQGDVTKIPVYGMTGMDEIIAKTPDALLSGESTAKIVESCCPSIKNAWGLSALDTDIIFTAIRIATYGNEISLLHTCPKCNTENQYDVDLGPVIEHFSKCRYDPKIVIDNLIVKVKPLTYEQKTKFGLRNFQLQQLLTQVEFMEDKDEQNLKIQELFKELGNIQNDLYISCVENVEVDGQVVNEGAYIVEWLKNCDKTVFDSIKKQIERNQEAWKIPRFPGKCTTCDNDINLGIDLDQSNFFV
jgi:hypothetical protein